MLWSYQGESKHRHVEQYNTSGFLSLPKEAFCFNSDPQIGNSRLDVKTAVAPRTAKITSHSILIEVTKFAAALGSPSRNLGINLSLLAAAIARSHPTKITFNISTWPYPVLKRALTEPTST